MTKIVYVPLDERPVNTEYPSAILAGHSDVELIIPPLELLGKKKIPAPIDQLWTWLEKNCKEANYLLLALDQLLYGGIVPSRLHNHSYKECTEYLNRLIQIKTSYPHLKILAFNLIMRVPASNSNDEEPDYYQDYGQDIYQWGWLQDLLSRGQGSNLDQKALQKTLKIIPQAVQEDYTKRRALNHFVNQEAIQLVEEQIIDLLVIPLDDCAEYGFSAAEQRKLHKLVEAKNLHDKIHIYPGADEVGSTLTARIFNELHKQTPRVFVRYSSTTGAQVVPRYEDRPLGESIKSQITICGGVMVDNSLEADLILMVNSPTLSGKNMPAASEAVLRKDTSYYSFRNLREFSTSLSYYLNTGKKVALADVAFSNGADHELMQILAKQNILSRLTSYAAWNTPGNTLGTVLAHACVRCTEEKLTGPDQFILDRYMEDWGYQVLVRAELKTNAAKLGITYFDLHDQKEKIQQLALTKLHAFSAQYLKDLNTNYELRAVDFPWQRLFEIKLISKFEK